jgi:hypothetical protein
MLFFRIGRRRWIGGNFWKFEDVWEGFFGVRLKMGGANLNFWSEITGGNYYFKNKKKIQWESAWKTDSNDIFFIGIPYSCKDPILNERGGETLTTW